jgi:hypothetical protein
MTVSFKKICAQGELGFIRLPDDAAIPTGARQVEAVNGRVIIGHSETGHHHCMLAERTDAYQLVDPLEMFLIVRDGDGNVADPDAGDVLTHLRDFDTHEPIRFAPGKYRVRKLREYTPTGFRRQED